MADFDWSKFTQKIYVHASVQDVYNAWATPAGLLKWFLRKADFTGTGGEGRNNGSVQKGDTYTWLWHGHGDETAEHGSILHANGYDKLSFVFGIAGTVTVTLKADGDDTEVILTQLNIPTNEQGKKSFHIGCSSGWTFYLANLKSILEGGLDLRNKDVERKGVINS